MFAPEREKVWYEFGPFRLDPDERSLWRGEVSVVLPPKVFDLLKLLVEQNGSTLDKETLLAQLWPDSFVEESSLTQLVFQLRKTLGESAAKQQYVETIPRRGYRFVGEVQQRRGSRTSDWLANANGVVEPDVTTTIPPAAPSPNGHITIKPRPSRWWWGLLLVPLFAFAAYRWLASSRPPPPFQTKTIRKLTTAHQATHPALSPDGHLVAYVQEEAGRQSLWLGQAATTNRVPLTPPAEVYMKGVSFAPDGQFVYFTVLNKGAQESELHAVSILGGAVRKIAHDVDSAVTFAPAGKQFAFIRNYPLQGESALFLAKADGTNERRLAVRKSPNHFSTEGPAWSPDGNVIAISVSHGKPGENFMQVVTINVADGREQPVGAQTWYAAGEVAWLRDGSGLVVSVWDQTAPVFADQIWHLAYPGGAARRVTDELTNYEGVTSAAKADVLAAWRSERRSHFWLVPANNSAQATRLNFNLSDNYSQLFGLDVAPAGQLLFGSHRSGNADLWALNAEGAGQRQLTSDAQREVMPMASPDGRYVVYVAVAGRTPHIWRRDADGSNPKQLTNGPGENLPSLTPDGQWVVFSSRAPGQHIAKVSIAGGAPIGLVSHVSSRPVVSPDGQWIACLYLDEEHNRIELALVPSAGGAATKIFRGLPRPDWDSFKWSPDSRALTFIQTQNGVSNLWLKPIDDSPPQQLTDFNSDRIFRFAWARDGKYLACERGEDLKDIVLISDFRNY
jgi:Tol biopolymer transport system component/DNA-binding winged helix-turn-helix (wHTH) protein